MTPLDHAAVAQVLNDVGFRAAVRDCGLASFVFAKHDSRAVETSIVIFPRNMIVERGEEKIDLQVIYEGVVQAVRAMVKSGEYT